MDLQLHNSQEKLTVSDAVFAADYKESLVHQLVTAYMAAGRAGTKAHKNRASVRGGGSKPWRQKGTGRARAGTIRSPLWRSGGVTFAAQPRDYTQKVNRKMYRAGIRAILSELARQDRLIVVEDIAVDAPKTKQLLGRLAELGVSKTLIVTETGDDKLYLSARNVPNVEISDVAGLSPVNLIRYEHIVITVGSVRAIEEWLS
ncbi:MAG: 50S ribosomal protein L4 [Gammaproteobacteria bacterium]|nr:50S ribosomal protein L4 [Gammaproteobacteria bacterium]NNJ97478.1 50S ribosomal protein L4 [Gammaproteobacteria bacterium]